MAQYHVSLNSQGYILDLDRYAKRIREPFAGKQSSGALALADLRGPEQVLLISDWSGGEGAVQHDVARPAQYRLGTGVDGFTAPGALRLGPRSVGVSAGASDFLMMQPYGANLYVASGLVSSFPRVYVWNGSTLTISHTATAPRLPSCMEVYSNRLYVGNSGDGTVASFDGTTWTAVAFTLAAGRASALATHYRQAAQYLYVAAAGGGLNGNCRMVFWDGSALSLGQYDHEEPGCDVLIPWRQHLWQFTKDTSRRVGGIYSIDDSTSGGIWETHGRLVGNYFTAGCVFNDLVYVATGVDGEIHAWDGTKLELVRRLATRTSAYSQRILGMAVWGGALWVQVTGSTASSVDLLRYDGAAWSRPLTLASIGTPGRLAVVNDGTLGLTTEFANAGAFVIVIPTQHQASGQLESGLIDCQLAGVSKLFRTVTIVTSAVVSPQSVQVEYRLEDTGSWTSLGTLSTVGATTATYAFPANTTGRQVAFRLTFSGSTGSGSAVVLYELALRYTPRPAVLREWELACVLEGTPELPMVTLDGDPSPLTGAQLTAALWTAAGTVGPVTLVDLDGASYSVYVQDVREEIGKISQRRGYQRLGLVKLVEAA